jgi:DNA-binding NarL/FixJ family response regulator
MKKISLAIVDDEALIISLLSDYFNQQNEIDACFVSTSGEAFLEALSNNTILPEVLILDLKMEGKSGIDILEVLKENYPSIKTIIMSSHYKKSFMGFMLKMGASAFIPKGLSPHDLLKIVIEVNQKGFYFKQDQLDIIREQVSTKAPEPKFNKDNVLSERELEILKLICFQKTAKEIGNQLFISQRTVEGHKNNLFLKTETKNIAGLAIYAIQNNIVKVDELMFTTYPN